MHRLRVQNVCDAVARWSLLVFVAALPFFVIPASWATVDEAKTLLVAGIVFVVLITWLVARIIEGTVVVPKNYILIAGALLPIAYAISAIVSKGSAVSFVGTSPGQDTVVAVLMLYALLLLTALVYQNVNKAEVMIMRAFFVGALVLVAFQLLRIAFPSSLTLGGVLAGSASSIFGSWHDLGIISGLVFLLSLVITPTPLLGGRLWKGIAGAAGIGAFALLIIVNTSDAWYVVAAFALLFALYTWNATRGEKLGRGMILRIALWVVLALLAGAAGRWSTTIYNHLPAPLQVVQFEVRPSWQGTFSVGEKVFSGGTTLLFGSGPNTFTRAWGLFKPTGVNQTLFWNVDFNEGVGTIPTSLVTVGIFGAIAWLALLLAFLWSLWRFVRGHHRQMSLTLVGFLTAFLYLIVFHIMYVPGLALSVLAFFFLGVIVALESRGERRAWQFSVDMRSTIGIGGLVGVIVAGGLIAYASGTAIRATISDMFVNRAVVIYNTSGNLADAVSMVGDALLVYPQNDRAHRAGIETGLLQLTALASSGATDDAARAKLQSALSDTIQHGLAAVSINANDYQNWLALANLYQNLAGAGISGAYENARAAYEKARSANPTNPLPLIGLAQVDIAQRNMTSALDELTQALALKPDLAAASFLRSQIEVTQGNFTAAVDDASVAIRSAPQDPLGWYNLGAIYYTAGSYSDAVPVLEKAVSLQNDYANALFVLALSFDKLGDHKDALTALQLVAEHNQNDPALNRMIANLNAGKPLGAQAPK